jgi:hypothetical protein
MKNTGIPLRLVGEDGNAYSILGRANKALRLGGRMDLAPAFQKEATAGDYDHLLRTCMEWFDVDDDEEDEEDYDDQMTEEWGV